MPGKHIELFNRYTRAMLTLRLLPETFAICRFAPDATLPAWAMGGAFWSVTRTAEELSVVCAAPVPDNVLAERGWRGLQVVGPLDFALTGILAGLTAPLAEAGVSIFALSTYDTDYLLVKAERIETAIAVLQGVGYVIER